jgi:hypothetical protein
MPAFSDEMMAAKRRIYDQYIKDQVHQRWYNLLEYIYIISQEFEGDIAWI